MGTSLFDEGDVQHRDTLTTTFPECFSSENRNRLLSAIGNTLKQAERKLVFLFKHVQNVQKDSNLAEKPVLPNPEKLLSGQSSPLYTDSSQLVPT